MNEYNDAVRGLISSIMNSKDPIFIERVFSEVQGKMLARMTGYPQLWECLQQASNNQISNGIDPLAVMAIAKRKEMEDGRSYKDALFQGDVDVAELTAIKEMKVSDAAGEHFADTVKRCDLVYKLNRLQMTIEGVTESEVGTYDEVKQKAEQAIFDSIVETNEVYEDLGDVGQEIVDVIDGSRQPKDLVVSTGKSYIDDWTGGFVSGRAFLFAALPGHAKSQSIYNVINGPVSRDEIVVVHFGLEDTAQTAMMTHLSLMTKPDTPWVLEDPMPQAITPVSANAISKMYSTKGKSATEEEKLSVKNAYHLWRKGANVFYETCNTPARMESAILRTRRMFPEKFVVAILDYIQMAGDWGLDEPRRIEQITHFIRSTLRDPKLGPLCWLVASQIDKAGSTKVKPEEVTDASVSSDFFSSSSMKGSSTLEQFADLIVSPFSPTQFNSGAERISKGHRIPINYYIGKNKVSRKIGPHFSSMDTKNGVIS